MFLKGKGRIFHTCVFFSVVVVVILVCREYNVNHGPLLLLLVVTPPPPPLVVLLLRWSRMRPSRGKAYMELDMEGMSRREKC